MILGRKRSLAEPLNIRQKRVIRRFEPIGWLLVRVLGHLSVLWSGLVSLVIGALRFHSLVFPPSREQLGTECSPNRDALLKLGSQLKRGMLCVKIETKPFGRI